MSFSVYIKEASISFGTDTDGEKVSYNLFFSGCSKNPKCKGCHNPNLQTRDESCKEELFEWIEEIKFCASELVEALVFLGGEPLDQPDAVFELAKEARELGMETWLYTSHEYQDIPHEIMDQIDIAVTGPYKEELHTGNFPASSNQEVIRRITE